MKNFTQVGNYESFPSCTYEFSSIFITCTDRIHLIFVNFYMRIRCFRYEKKFVRVVCSRIRSSWVACSQGNAPADRVVSIFPQQLFILYTRHGQRRRESWPICLSDKSCKWKSHHYARISHESGTLFRARVLNTNLTNNEFFHVLVRNGPIFVYCFIPFFRYLYVNFIHKFVYFII